MEGFAVPHSHFRVFQSHGTPENGSAGGRDELLLRFVPGRGDCAPLDSHLREFAQLEAQVKALQQRPQTRSSLSPSSRLVDIEYDAALAEAFSFYSRLMTPESFSWPDFLATVFTKLTEHYFSSESDLVRKAILQIFQRTQAHVAQISDGGRIVSHLSAQLVRAEGEDSIDKRIGVIEFLGVIPNLLHSEAAIHDQLLRSLRSSHPLEIHTTIASIEVVLPRSDQLRRAIFREVLASNSPRTISLLPLAIGTAEYEQGQKGWKFCVEQFHSQTDCSLAINCLKAAGQLALRFPQVLIADHLGFVGYIIKNDPRFDIVINSLPAIDNGIALDPELRSHYLKVIKLLLHSETPTDAKYVALQSLKSLLHPDCKEATELVKFAQEVSTGHQILEIACIELVGEALKIELQTARQRSPSPASTQASLFKWLEILGQHVSLVRWQDRRDVWSSAVEQFVSLACEYPKELGEPIGKFFFKVLRAGHQPCLEKMHKQVWFALSRFSHCCPRVIKANSDLFEGHAASRHDQGIRQLIAACLIYTSLFSKSTSANRLVKSLLAQSSPSDRHMFAKVAMTHGAFEIAATMLTSISAGLDHEFSASWSAALLKICETEVETKETRVVSMMACEKMGEARQLMQTISLRSYKLGFQIRFMDARIRWLKALIHAQQLVGSASLTKAIRTSRAVQLCKLFENCGKEFSTIRSKMWGAAPCDVDVLAYHGHMCFLLATGAMDLLVPQGSGHPIQFKPPRKRSTKFLPLFDAVETLIGDIKLKSRQLLMLQRSRQGIVGAMIFRQLLDEVINWPALMPQQFFRCTLGQFTITAKASFLTHAEAVAYPSKPRPRSQVGVALGTQFSCSLKGAITFASAGVTTDDVAFIRVTIRLHHAEQYAEHVNLESATMVKETVVPVDGSELNLLMTNSSAYYPFEIPVSVANKLISSKGTYLLVAEVSLIDRSQECWDVTGSACTRNIIVY